MRSRKTRYGELKQAGKCTSHPSRDAVIGTTQCQWCLNKNKSNYSARVAAGKCTSHPNETAVPGKTICQFCIDEDRRFRELCKAQRKCHKHPERDVLPGRNICGLCDHSGWKNHIRRVFGITPEQYLVLLEEQGGVCAVCDLSPADGQRLSIDHDHSNNQIRGLLHSKCNLLLGQFKECPKTIRRVARGAIRYLEKHHLLAAEESNNQNKEDK